MPHALSLSGQRFGKLTVLERTTSDTGRSMWLCRCDCGVERVAAGAFLTYGHVRSCGCLHKEVVRTHGLSKSPEYKTWGGAQRRCLPAYERHADYYDRGITFYPDWKGPGGFARFLAHVGRKPSPNHSLDRIDNNRGYEPGNVRWADSQTQVLNRRIKHIEQFSDVEFAAEARRRGFTLVSLS